MNGFTNRLFVSIQTVPALHRKRLVSRFFVCACFSLRMIGVGSCRGRCYSQYILPWNEVEPGFNLWFDTRVEPYSVVRVTVTRSRIRSSTVLVAIACRTFYAGCDARFRAPGDPPLFWLP